MPEIQAFRGIRYDLGHVGSLSDVIAPPYDVIGPELQDQLYNKHPCNVVRLILNRKEPGDDDAEQPLHPGPATSSRTGSPRACCSPRPTRRIYVYHQEFTVAGRTFIRRGFMARLRLARFGEGKRLPARRDACPAPRSTG